MADEPDSSLDLTGMGKLAKAIPPRAWDKLVTTACDTFTQTLAPITATTSGLGRLIQGWFDRLIDAQKVLAADVMSGATRKANAKARKPAAALPSGSLIIAALTAASTETDETLRELWSNLLAQELTHGQVHPEFVEILRRISPYDAQTLSDIASEGDRTLKRAPVNVFMKSLIKAGFMRITEGGTFSTEQLEKLRLIARKDGIWNLTATGHAFIAAVSDPSVIDDDK